MSTTPIDPVAAANDLANKYFAASEALADFISNANPPLPTAQQEAIRKQALDLQDMATDATSDAIKANLASIQDDLQKIKDTTAKAASQLGKMQTVDKIITVAAAVLKLGTTIASIPPNPVDILAAADKLAATVIANT